MDLIFLLGAALLAMGVRWGVIGHALDRLEDPDEYLGLARSLVRGEGLQINGQLTAYRPPLYPILLAPCVFLVDGPRLPMALAALHLGLGALTVVLVADSARRWGLPRRIVWFATLVPALDPVLVVQARALMTETWAAALVALTLWGVTLGSWLGPVVGGVGFGLAALCRPSLLPAAGLWALLGCLVGSGAWSGRILRSVVLLGTTLAVVAPWAVRNWIVLGEAVWTTTHGGYTLALANNPIYYADVLNGPPGAVWSRPLQIAWIDSINEATKRLTEPDADRWLRRQAVAFARTHPQDFLRATGARLGRFWGVMPAGAVYPGPLRWATAAWTIPLWILLGLGLGSGKAIQWPRSAALAFLITLTVVHSCYWTDLRMRAPLVPAIALVASLGLAELAQRWRNGPVSPPKFIPFRSSSRGLAEVNKNQKIPIFLLGKISSLD